MAKLLLRDELTKQSWQVWPTSDPIPSGSIHENGRYVFEYEGLPGDGTSAILSINDDPLEALRTTRDDVARWRWEVGFNAGSVEASLVPRLGQSAIRFEIVTDAELRKLTREEFECMVRDILDDTFALFSLSNFHVGIAGSNTNRPPPIARLQFLRSRMDELEKVVRLISLGPKRRLTETQAVIPYHRAAGATPIDVLRSFRGSEILRAPVPNELPPALRGFIPARIKKRIKKNSLDIPEHRQMLGALRNWQNWLGLVAQQLDAMGGGEDRERGTAAQTWARRCRSLSRRLETLCGLPLFSDVAPSKDPLRLSALFRGHPQYRRFFDVWRDMNLGLAAVFGDFLNMPLARTWELYELWCFLRIVRAGAELFGNIPPDTASLFTADADGGLTLKRGAVCVSYGSGWALYFQREYQEFWEEADGTGTYSRHMIPDIAVNEIQSDGRRTLVLLDAKYRSADGLNDAVSSVHTYRDALVREAKAGKTEEVVTAAYLLTPMLPDVSSGSYRTQAMPGRLFRPDYQHQFRIGALTFKPGMDHRSILEALRSVLTDAGASLPHGHS